MKKKRVRIRDEQKGVIFIGIIVFIMILVSIIFSVSLKTNKVLDSIKNNEVIRMLFITENDDSEVLFSSLIVYYPSSHKAAIVSIPNHTGQIYQSLGRVDKISTVYSEKGVEAYKKEVETLFGVTIPYYSIISIDNLMRLTDMLGGMRIFISSPIDYTDSNGVLYLLPSGVVNLDGDKIHTYLYYRVPEENESDVQDRYQNVMAAFLTGLHDKNFIILDKGNEKKFFDCLKINLEEQDEKMALFSSISEVDAESIIRQTITGSIRNVDGQQLLFPLNNGEFIKEAIKQTTSMLVSTDGTITSRVYVLEIQNGTTIQGLARNTSILFQNASYDVLSAVNADRNDYEETVIIDHIGNEEVAKMVGEFIHCNNIKQQNSDLEVEGYSNTDANVDFTIILGKDFNGRYVIPKRSK